MIHDSSGPRRVKPMLERLGAKVWDPSKVVLVTDHGRVVAELRLPGVADRAASPDELRYRRLVEAGRLVPGARAEARAWPPAPSVRLAPGSAAGLLDAERGDT